jgi:hypothetical protein
MGLSFLTPALLGGAALVAVPLILHLAMRRRPVPHVFPALRLLQQRAVSNRRRLRLRHLLLLAVRVAALMLLALALARPVLKGAGWLADTEAPVAAAFVFDTAPRMGLREANRTRLEQATALARVLFGRLPAGSVVAVIDTSGEPAAFAPSPAAAEARIGRLVVGTPAQSLPAAIAAGRRLLAGADQPRRELYVFTDCSRGAWERGAAAEEAAAEDGTRVLFIDVAAAEPRDFAIESLTLASDQVAAGTPVGISAALARTGPDESRSVAVEILMPDGRYARRAVKPVDWRAAGTPTVDFDIPGLEPGTRQGRVVIDGGDDLVADDVRSFTVVVGAPAGIIVAAPAPADRSGLFLAQALAPAALARAGQARFTLRLVPYEGLDTADWEAARGIVLLDPPPLEPRTWEALGRWVAGGRGLVVWLGPRARSAEAFNTPAARSVLGGGIVRVWRTPAGGNYLAPDALDHPLLGAFRRVGDAVPWQDFPVLRHWEFAPDAPDEAAAAPAADTEAAGTTTAVAAFRNGLPAILERRLGRGTVVIATTAVSQAADDPEAWNTLATGFEPWPFVILANEMVLHAIDTVADRNILAGTPAVVPLDRRDVATAFVRTPNGDDFPAVVDRQRGAVTVTATQEPGNYGVQVGGRDGGVATGFSVNLDPSATDFRRLDPESLAAALGPGARLARTEDELVRDVALDRIGAELFGWVILLAALAMAGDWIVANRFYAPRDEAASRPAADFKSDANAAAAAAGGGPPPVPPAPPPVPAAPPSAPPVPRGGPPPVPELGA